MLKLSFSLNYTKNGNISYLVLEFYQLISNKKLYKESSIKIQVLSLTFGIHLKKKFK